MSFDKCFIKSGKVSDCLTGNRPSGMDIECNTSDITFSVNVAANTSLKNWLTKYRQHQNIYTVQFQ